MVMRDADVPMVDIGCLLDGGGGDACDRQRAAAQILDACKTLGVFYAVGHGIDAAERRAAFAAADAFFRLPPEQKRQLPALSGGFTRGYIGFGGESGSARLECKEAFSYGFPWDSAAPPTNPMQGPNVWPETAAAAAALGDGWRPAMLRVFAQMVRASEAVARGLSLGLGQPENFLAGLCGGGDTISLMRLFHYVPYDSAEAEAAAAAAAAAASAAAATATAAAVGETAAAVGEEPASTLAAAATEGQPAALGNQPSLELVATRAGSRIKPGDGPERIGSSPHTDWGFTTAILQDGAGGLQLRHPETREWLAVPPWPRHCGGGSDDDGGEDGGGSGGGSRGDGSEEALVFNCGDYLSLLTGGLLRSPVHRVDSPLAERLSFVFFYYPNYLAKGTMRISPQAPATGAAGATGALVVADTGRQEAGAAAARRKELEKAELATDAASTEAAAAATAADEDYNTLLSTNSGLDLNAVPFGEYIQRKWKEVFRPSAS